MKEIEPRALFCFIALVFVGCGNSDATDFFTSESVEGGGSGGMSAGGSAGATSPGGAGPAGSGGSQQSGAGGAAGSGTGADGGSGGSAGSGLGGVAGTGGTTAGGSGGGVGGTISTGGATSYSCGSLNCFRGQQVCTRTPTTSGGEQRMCLPIPDSCSSLDCSCFCKEPLMDPCGPASSCTCSGADGRIMITCGG